ncbi:unnamed protein product [marine sediment metagenome]|uniref:Uncharacterized protein n=1 Tax=marine sediment metagenome TaxID=412755 RepID=X1F820_9ZZZZ
MGAVEDKARELTKRLDEIQEEAKSLAETMPGLLRSLDEKVREAEIMIKKRRKVLNER